MKLKTLMTVSAAIACPSGLAYMVAPNVLFGGSGMELAGAGVMVARMYGAQVFGIGMLAWFTRTLPATPVRRLIVRVFCGIDTLNLTLALVTVMGGYKDWSGWFDVVGFALFSAGYGYFGFLRKDRDRKRDE